MKPWREVKGGQVKAVLWKVIGLNLAVALAKLLYGLKTGAISMVADGYHSLLDSSSNIMGLVGIWIAFRPADASRIPPEVIAALVRRMPGVLDCQRIRTRGLRDHVHMDLTIQVDPAMTIPEAHKIADQVEEMLCRAGIGVVDVIVHVEPLKKDRGSGYRG